MLKRLILCALLAVLTTAAGCNTIKGLGQDVQGAGKALERAAD